MKHIAIVTHEVADFATWKVGFDAHNPVREAHGIRVIDLLTDAQNPNMVTGLMEVTDLDSFNTLFNSAELREAMTKGGVISAPEVRILISKN